jgi:hypothetical protein
MRRKRAWTMDGAAELCAADILTVRTVMASYIVRKS